MNTQTNEQAFEAQVEATLLGPGGWQRGTTAEWDVERALFPTQVCSFLAETQPTLWAQMRTLHGPGLENLLIDALVKELDIKGALHVLRHGFKFYGKTFRLAHFKPAHALNDEVLALYAQNKLTITRQVPCHPNKPDTVDLCIRTKRAARGDLRTEKSRHRPKLAASRAAISRGPQLPRTAVPLQDTGTRTFCRRSGRSTHEHTPQRRGHALPPLQPRQPPKRGAMRRGQPAAHLGGSHRLFLARSAKAQQLPHILGHFMFVEKKEEKTDARRIVHETMIFPRYHQLDSVRQLVAAARADGTGQNYLVQHSAGSGKTNSISWLAHRLASLHDNEDRKIFDCVVVITDRRVLDQQLQDAIYQIEHAQGVVKAIDQDSQQLANALIDGTKIVVTTLQKFPFVLRGLLRTAGAESQEAATAEERSQAKAWEAEIGKRRYAVIVDEAHSSQTGETARELKEILGAGTDAEDE